MKSIVIKLLFLESLNFKAILLAYILIQFVVHENVYHSFPVKKEILSLFAERIDSHFNNCVSFANEKFNTVFIKNWPEVN